MPWLLKAPILEEALSLLRVRKRTMTWFSQGSTEIELKITTVLLFRILHSTEIKLKIKMVNSSSSMFHLSCTSLRTIQSLRASFHWRSSTPITIGSTWWIRSRSQGWPPLGSSRWLTWSPWYIIIWKPLLSLLHIHRPRINSISRRRPRWYRPEQGMKHSCLLREGRHQTRNRYLIISLLKGHSMIRLPLKAGRVCSAVNLRLFYSPASLHGTLLKLLIKMGFV